MIELTGKYADCKIFNDDVDQASISQVYTFLNHPAFENKKVRFMPDIHKGAGAVIGTTVELGDFVIPNTIGVDIGCGMSSCMIGDIDINFKALDRHIKQNIPSGFSTNNSQQNVSSSLEVDVKKVCKKIGISNERALLSLGTLGSGNHFIEVGVDENNDKWITVHSGSRNFGLQIAKYHQKVAEKLLHSPSIDITTLPKEDRESYKKIMANKRSKIPKGMEYLHGDHAEKYFEHMDVAQRYASSSRQIMLTSIIKYLKVDKWKYCESVHNYIDFEAKMIRKGAISAKKGELVIIPWNMRDGLIIGEGKGNPDWNFSAPHGAGRIMSRSKAKEAITLEEFKTSMEGIHSSCVEKSTIDESPMAYKDPASIEENLVDSVEVKLRVKPLYNFKAH